MFVISSTNAKLGLPFKDGHDSKFSFGVEQSSETAFLDCTGSLYVRRLSNHLLIQFKNFLTHKRINVNAKFLDEATTIPIVMKFGSNMKLLNPKDYNYWGWIDPRITAKVIKYADIPDDGKYLEEGWEINDLGCPLRTNVTDYGDHLQFKLKYILDGCVEEVEDEVIKEHYRDIIMNVDKKYDYITKIDYHYQKVTENYDQQNNVYLKFEEFVKY